MIPDIQPSDDWAAADGWGQPAGGQTRLGPDLLSFLCDFRTARREEATRARQAAVARRRSSDRPSGTLPPAADQTPEAEVLDPYAGSETPVSPDWWLASDGRWYPPELHPEVQLAPGAGGPTGSNGGDPLYADVLVGVSLACCS